MSVKREDGRKNTTKLYFYNSSSNSIMLRTPALFFYIKSNIEKHKPQLIASKTPSFFLRTDRVYLMRAWGAYLFADISFYVNEGFQGAI